MKVFIVVSSWTDLELHYQQYKDCFLDEAQAYKYALNCSNQSSEKFEVLTKDFLEDYSPKIGNLKGRVTWDPNIEPVLTNITYELNVGDKVKVMRKPYKNLIGTIDSIALDDCFGGYRVVFDNGTHNDFTKEELIKI